MILKILDLAYFEEYKSKLQFDLNPKIEQYNFSEANGNFTYLTKASAVYSSNIEGNSIDLNSFMNYELNKSKFKQTKETKEIENLITAYSFAQNNKLTEDNLLHCHKILAETLLIKSKRGKYRIEPIGVFGKSGLAYLAVKPEFVPKEMNKLFYDIAQLLQAKITTEEVFYYAAFIHLKFAHIHPFLDGNGRAARLLEKWFIAEKLGKKFWMLPAEENYKVNQQRYYDALNLGVNYYELDYRKCLNFLLMLV